jgi:Ca2+-binding EF-hand superfamily protein
MVVLPIGVTYAQDSDAVGAQLKAAGEKIRAASEAGKFTSAEEALAKWHEVKVRIIKEAVAAGEISKEEADMLRREIEKAEAAELAKAAAGVKDVQAVGARLGAAGEKFRATVEEAFAKWHETKERIINDAVARGEISREEAGMLRREIEKAEAAELAKAATGTPATERVTAKQILSNLDKNGDGKISKGEASKDLKPFFEQVDANNDGAIDVKEAQVMADYQNNQQAGSTEPAPAGGPVTAKQIISYMDKNGDGQITKNEASEDLKLFFEQYDVNKDGTIDLKETQALVKYVNREQFESSEPAPAPGRVTAKQIISYMDKNNDGRITEDEASEELKPTFQFIDTNGDGAIDVKEARVMADYANKASSR